MEMNNWQEYRPMGSGHCGKTQSGKGSYPPPLRQEPIRKNLLSPAIKARTNQEAGQSSYHPPLRQTSQPTIIKGNPHGPSHTGKPFTAATKAWEKGIHNTPHVPLAPWPGNQNDLCFHPGYPAPNALLSRSCDSSEKGILETKLKTGSRLTPILMAGMLPTPPSTGNKWELKMTLEGEGSERNGKKKECQSNWRRNRKETMKMGTSELNPRASSGKTSTIQGRGGTQSNRKPRVGCVTKSPCEA